MRDSFPGDPIDLSSNSKQLNYGADRGHRRSNALVSRDPSDTKVRHFAACRQRPSYRIRR